MRTTLQDEDGVTYDLLGIGKWFLLERSGSYFHATLRLGSYELVLSSNLGMLEKQDNLGFSRTVISLY